MHVASLFSSFLLAGCFLAPPGAAVQSEKAPRALTAAELFPVPKQPLVIRVTPEARTSLDAVLEDFARLADQHLVISKETRQVLQVSHCGLLRDVEVPPERVWEFVETLLANTDFVIVPLSTSAPRLLGVYSLNSQQRNNIRERSTRVRPDELGIYARHPALLVTTVVELPSTDVRTLSNSMRTMFTDANTQQIIPVGKSNTLIITGFGPAVAGIVETLRIVDDATRSELERNPKPARTEPREERAVDEPAEAKPAQKKPN